MSTAIDAANSQVTVVDDHQDSCLIDDTSHRNYRAWKKNAPFLYDYLSTHALLWPSLSVQFFPDLQTISNESALGLASQKSQADLQVQRLIYGTYTMGQAVDSISIASLPMFRHITRHVTVSNLDYNAEKQEFELSQASCPKLKVIQQINHRGDVNRVKYMPQNPNVLATANNLGDVNIYERTKHSSLKRHQLSADEGAGIASPEICLKGITSVNASDVFAMDWNPQREADIVTASMAGDINIYDIRRQYLAQSHTIAQTQYFPNGAGVNDIEWFGGHDSIFLVGDEAGYLKVYDTRTAAEPVVKQQVVSQFGVNSVSVHPTNSSAIGYGDSAGHVGVWDLRNMGHPDANEFTSIHDQHTDAITQLRWHRSRANVLASSSQDRLVRLFDILSCEDPKLLFIHAGHMLGVNDFDWSYHEDWTIASVADDNSLHVWRPATNIVG